MVLIGTVWIIFVSLQSENQCNGLMKKLISQYWHELRSHVSMFKFVSGIVVAIVMSLTFYAFSCVMLEAFRVVSVTPEYDMWVLGDKERSFYQLFFAFVSVILAHSFCLAYWFDGPRRIFEKGHRSAVMIVNGQRNLNWYFLSWFAKVVLCWLVLITFPGWFYVFPLYPGLTGLFILIIIVLFLHPWVAMRLAFKRKTLKWMALSALMVSALAFGLSRINLVDYKSLENAFLSRNVPHVFGLELPATDAAQKMEHINLTKNVYLVQSNDATDPKCLIIVDGQTVDLQKFPEVMEEWRSCYNEADAPLLSCRLNIDKSLKMKDVDEVREALANMRFCRIQYAVIPKTPELDSRYYTFLSLPMRMPVRFVDTSAYQEMLHDIGDNPDQINVSQNTSRDYLINGVSMRGEGCKSVLKRLMQQDPNYVIRFKVNEDMLYGDYMVILTTAFEALNELKDEYAMGKYSKHLEQVCSDEEVKDINDHFPFRFFEESDDLLR